MVYDVALILNSTNPLEYMQESNNLTHGIIGGGLLIILFLIILMIALNYTNHFGKSVLASSLASSFIALLFVLAKLSSWYFVIVFSVGIVIGITMLQDRDYGT